MERGPSSPAPTGQRATCSIAWPKAAEEKPAPSPAAKPAETTKPPGASKKVPPAPPLDWKAEVAAAKITPDTLMLMAGYAARKQPAEGTLQELYAKALALEDEAEPQLTPAASSDNPVRYDRD